MTNTSSNTQFLVIGAGNMGGALLSGWVSGRCPIMSPSQLVILDPKPSEAALGAIKKGAIHLSQPSDEVGQADVVLVATKPQLFETVAKEVLPYIKSGALVISIMAGTTLETLSKALPNQFHIRAMPNTPAAIKEGVTAFVSGAGVKTPQKKLAKKLLSAGGKVAEVETENLIDVVTAVSGSGPAYVFHLAEALEAAAIKIGMPEDIAPLFARQTIIGAGALLKNDERSAKQLREAVTSPNGTTQAALDVLMDNGAMALLMRETVTAALKRSKELGQA